MRDINRFTGDNLGGIIHFRYIPSGDVLSIPKAVNSRVLEEIVLKEGKQIYCGYGTLETMGFEEDGDPTKHGTLYKKKFVAIVPKDSADNTDLFHEMRNNTFIVIGRDSNGLIKIYGSIEEPLSFRMGRKTKTQIAMRNEVAIEFYGEGTFASYAYDI